MERHELSDDQLDVVAGGGVMDAILGLLVDRIYNEGPVAWAQEQVKNAQDKQRKR
jgi:hypothetical protein